MPFMVMVDGNGVISLPGDLIHELGWVKGDELDMTVDNGNSIIEGNNLLTD